MSHQIVSLFDMHIDMGERIAGKQDRPSPIIEDPLFYYLLFFFVVLMSPV